MVSSEETYVVSIVNRGNTAATGIKIACFPKASMGLSATVGPMGQTLNEKKSEFMLLANLTPQEEVEWSVRIHSPTKSDDRE
tara:strand:+ start:282 stop:527 length:246 start_codon:yes stop_codon:yes gene_type:complete